MTSETYGARHQRMRKALGSASAHSCVEVGCGQPARDWATIHGRSGADPHSDYQPMCRSHHLLYDREARRPAEGWRAGLAQMHSPEARVKAADAQRGRRMSDQQREQIRQANLGRVLSPETKARISEGVRRHHATKAAEAATATERQTT